MADLQGQVGELSFTVQITRKDSGQVEEYQMVGYLNEEQLKGLTHGNHPLDGGPQRSD
jgi:hypothetical protein